MDLVKLLDLSDLTVTTGALNFTTESKGRIDAKISTLYVEDESTPIDGKWGWTDRKNNSTAAFWVQLKNFGTEGDIAFARLNLNIQGTFFHDRVKREDRRKKKYPVC